MTTVMVRCDLAGAAPIVTFPDEDDTADDVVENVTWFQIYTRLVGA